MVFKRMIFFFLTSFKRMIKRQNIAIENKNIQSRRKQRVSNCMRFPVNTDHIFRPHSFHSLNKILNKQEIFDSLINSHQTQIKTNLL